jgi:hypothetical protein
MSKRLSTICVAVLSATSLTVLLSAQSVPSAPQNLRIVGSPPPPPPPPPPPTGGIPTGWNDARFAGVTPRAVNSYGLSGTIQNFEIISSTGDPLMGCSRFSALTFRLQGREGVRVCGGDVLLEDFYLRIAGTTSADHADAIQHYIGSPGTTLRDRNGNAGYQLIARRGVIEINGTCTAGLFSADGSRGRIWLEDVKFIGSCQGLRVNVDGGGPLSCVRCVFTRTPQIDVAVDVWENNTMINGSPVARP